jgi:hypothetical protein
MGRCLYYNLTYISLLPFFCVLGVASGLSELFGLGRFPLAS